MNSNAMKYEFAVDGVTIHTIGGVWDLFVIVADSPVALVRKYHSMIGRPAFPPKWSLGWQQSKVWNVLDLVIV